MKLNDGNHDAAPAKAETLQAMLSRLAGFNVGEPQTKHFLSATSKTELQVINVVSEEIVQFPRNVPMKEVKSLFKISMPVMITRVVNTRNDSWFPMKDTGLN